MKHLFLPFIVGLCLAACSKPGPDQLIYQAELALANGDIEAARDCCVELSNTHATMLTPSILCRQALIYAQLADGNDDLQDMASATECLNHALAINKDSVNLFYESIDIEKRAQLKLVNSLIAGNNEEI